jgi:hypothetical protein
MFQRSIDKGADEQIRITAFSGTAAQNNNSHLDISPVKLNSYKISQGHDFGEHAI